jgi:hypothetical protein
MKQPALSRAVPLARVPDLGFPMAAISRRSRTVIGSVTSTA